MTISLSPASHAVRMTAGRGRTKEISALLVALRMLLAIAATGYSMRPFNPTL